MGSAIYENVFSVNLATGITCENDKIYTSMTDPCPDIELKICCAPDS